MSQPVLIDVDLDLRVGDELVCGQHEWLVLNVGGEQWQTRDSRGFVEWMSANTIRWILRSGGVALRGGKQVAL